MEYFREKFDSRYKTALTDSHLLANLLDPRYSGKKLTATEREKAVQLIRDDCPDFTSLYMKFKTKSSPFNDQFFANSTLDSINPRDWWRYFVADMPISTNRCSPKRLIEVLFTAVSSSAGVERIFSIYGLVQNDLRNRLGNEKTAKLVSIYKFLNS